MEFRCAVEKLFFIGWLCISQKSRSFSQPKHHLFEQAILLFSNAANFRNRHRKFAPSHNLLSAKEHGCSFYVRSKSLRCNAGASHRFKSLPAIPGKVAVPGVAGYLMNAGHFSESHVSTGDLNRPRSPEVRKPLVYFWFFSYTRKE